MMYYNQESINLFVAWYDTQPVCTVNAKYLYTVNICYFQVLAMYKKALI